MRRLVLGSVLVLLSLGLTGPPADAITRHQCRAQWSDLVQFHAENDNPRGPVRQLNRRWDATYERARAYAESATAHDCGQVIEDYSLAWEQLESFMYDLHPYDIERRLASAERDRRHALERDGTKHLSPRLERQFRIARRQAPRAVADLAPTLRRAPSVDVSDAAQVEGYLQELHAAAEASKNVRTFGRALRIIGNAELHEE